MGGPFNKPFGGGGGGSSGADVYQGTWDATSGAPSATPVNGWYWRCNVGGVFDSKTWTVGDLIVAHVVGGVTTWGQVQGGAVVDSFNTRTGAVVPATSDYDAVQVDYDNSTSGLSATDVKGAIDENNGMVATNTALLSGYSSTPFASAVQAVALKITTTEASTPVTIARTDARNIYVRFSYTATGAVAVALPAISGMDADQTVTLVDIGLSIGAAGAGTNNITITPNGSDTIINAATLVMNSDNEAQMLVANKTTNNWEAN